MLELRRQALLLCLFSFWTTCALAAVQFTNRDFNKVTAGQTFTLTWSGASGPVEILLKNGPSTALVTVSTVATGQTGTSFTYTVPANIPSDTYAFTITDGTSTNYSPQFQIVGAVTVPTSSTSTTTSNTIPTSNTSATKTFSTSTSQTTSSKSSSSSETSAKTTNQDSSSTSSTTSISSTSSATLTPTQNTSKSSIITVPASPTSTPVTPNSSTIATSFITPPSSGLSTGSKAAIGVGATFGVVIIAGILTLVFCLGRRTAQKKEKGGIGTEPHRVELHGRSQAHELTDGTPLTSEEKVELERRRRASELQGSATVVKKAGGVVSERAELEGLRRWAELG
ncbi:Ser-Thr-rich glycosyl-phosphatidyl-inositol-anchored membrane family-domain-containing protein [Tricladium varicosporioides]|nr:Ser-Thr-rich glycosyl-phosphatidyl-inositol-anchored membrane family-domain-containing protein [Hymenoscyphus varicosporioides]